jgi:pimeloyl-ACP methyl ester carboxylesterase
MSILTVTRRIYPGVLRDVYARLSVAVCLLALASGSVYAAQLVQHTVLEQGHPIAVWEKSPGKLNETSISNKTIVLIHGRTWSSLPDFDLQVEGEDLSLMDGLVASGYRVFAIDLRGYGATPRDQSGWNTPDKAARDTRAVLKWIVMQTGAPPTLFGWSNGSLVAQLAAQRWPELVSGIILFGYPADPDMDPGKLPEPPAKPARQTNTANNAASDFITPGTISQAAIDEYVRHSLAADPLRADWNELQQWGELNPALVTVPILLLQGEHDPLAPDDQQSKLFTRLGTADRQWITLPNSDHAALLESVRPYFIQAIVNFLERPMSE